MLRTEEAKAAGSAQYDEELQERAEAATADGVARAWKSFGSDIGTALKAEDLQDEYLL